jgi:hypothetical protein
VAVDTSVVESPGWWMQYLSTLLTRRQEELELVWNYYVGNPPLPKGAENARPVFQAFQRQARSNFAALIVDAVVERLRVRAIRTAVDNDDDGDADAWAMFRRNRLHLGLGDAIRWATLFGESYMSAQAPRGPGQRAVLLPEHPAQTIAVCSPENPYEPRAALKMVNDPVTGTDYAHLWLPAGALGGTAQKFTASRQNSNRRTTSNLVGTARIPRFSAQSYEPVATEQLRTARVPIVPFRNPEGLGEFVPHVDVLDRINHMLLQRMVIATLQAFRQRAVLQDLPDVDDAGTPIDYDKIFTSDPGAFWRLPKDTQLWESGQADLTPMLSSVKDDVLHLAAVSRTPLSMFTPDAATQSAEGAQLQREAHVFKVEDRQDRHGESLSALVGSGYELEGDTRRADLDVLSIDWSPAERYGLAEKGAAALAATTSGMPWRARASEIWQKSPADVDRWETMRLEDAALVPAVAVQRTTTAATGQNASTRAVGANQGAQAAGRNVAADLAAAAAQDGS